MPEGIKTPISEAMLQTAIRGGQFVNTGNNNVEPAPQAVPVEQGSAWMAPMQPLQVSTPADVKGRAFDYPVGYNVNIKPRAYEPVTFDQLRALADNLDILRLVIETRKDLVCALEIEIVPKKDGIEPDARCKEVQDFLELPDKEHTWAEWLRMLLEDLLVIDAPAIYPLLTKGGKLYTLEPIDGATISRKIDLSGRTPIPPQPAYQQILKGVPAGNFTRDELIYKPRNKRTNKLYGFSPVEQIMMTVNIALRRQLSQLQFYTEGSVPDMMLACPTDWTPDQVRMMQGYWDEVMGGNTGERRKAKFVPGGMTPINTKEGLLKDEFDEWIARIVCYAFSVPNMAFIKQMNRATAGTAVDQAVSEGLLPILQWVKSLVDYIIIKYFGYTDVVMIFTDSKDPDLAQEAAIKLQNSQSDQIDISTGVLDVNEVRINRGLDPLTPQELEERKPAPQPQLAGQIDNGSKPAPDEPLPPDATVKEPTAKLKKFDEGKIVRDDKGRFAGGAGSGETYHRYTNGDVDTGMGYTMFASDEEASSSYGDNHYTVSTGDLPAGTIVQASSQEFQDQVAAALAEHEDLMSEYQPDAEAPEEAAQSLASELNPSDIVNSAQIWDAPDLVQVIYDQVLEPQGITGVETQDGFILFDSSFAKEVGVDKFDKAKLKKFKSSLQKKKPGLQSHRLTVTGPRY